MTRGRYLLAGVVLLLAAAWMRPEAVSDAPTPLGAVGASMGGARVLVLDGLFLRAEALRRTGRTEDAASLYRTVLELDPENEPAVVFLVNTYIDELLPLGLDLGERFAWWEAARALLVDALSRRPRSAVLQDRLASLYLDVLRGHADLLPLLEKAHGDPRRAALRHLRIAIDEVEVLPRQGRTHLLRASLLAQDVGVQALADGDDAALGEALATADELLARRGAVLGSMSLGLEEGPDPARLLAAAVVAIRAVEAAREEPAGKTIAAARIVAYASLLPSSALPAQLQDVLAQVR